MSANAAGLVESASAGAGVGGDGLLDDQAILCELSDALAGVGRADFGDLVGIEPDLALADAEDRRSKALLSAEVDPVGQIESAMASF
jgi:hypothetical protein